MKFADQREKAFCIFFTSTKVPSCSTSRLIASHIPFFIFMKNECSLFDGLPSEVGTPRGIKGVTLSQLVQSQIFLFNKIFLSRLLSIFITTITTSATTIILNN